MTRKPSRHLLDMLASLPDPRKEKGKRHPLKAILALAIIAMISGYRSYAAIAEYGRTYKLLNNFSRLSFLLNSQQIGTLKR